MGTSEADELRIFPGSSSGGIPVPIKSPMNELAKERKASEL